METFKPTTYSRGRAALLASACLLSPLVAGELRSSSAVADQALSQRTAAVDEAQELLKKGDEAYTARRYSDAVEAYSGARELIPNAPISAALRAAATDRYAQASVEHARVLSRKGDVAAAKAAVSRVLVQSVAPENPGAIAMLAQLNDPIRTNPALTAEHAKNVDAVRRLLYTAEGDYNLGNFNEANARYEEVLRIDPTNTAARRGMEKLTTAQGDYFKSAYDQTRAKMLAEVDSQWEDQIPPFLAPIEVDPSAGSTDSDLVALKNKLERIIIPNFALDQASLADAIDLLRARTLEYNTLETDLDRKAINFTLNLGPPDSAAAKKVTAVRIDLNVNNLPVSEILKQITLATSTSYSTDSYAVNITAAGSESQEVISQNYRVPPDFITSLSAGETATFDEMPKEGLLPIRLGIKEALMKQGVSFPEGTSAYLVDSNLQVLNTPQNQDLISQIVAIHASTEPVLINVKVTMIKVEQTRLEELGFDWILNNGGFGGPSWVPGASRLNLTGGSTGNGKSLKDIALPVGASDLYPVTAGNRSGDSAILGNTLDGLISRASGSQTSNPAPGVLGLRGNLSGADYQMLMRGLGQSKGVDMMARPSVSTRSGQATNITFVREFIYPTAYEPPQLPQSTAGTRVVGSDSFFGGGGGGPSPVTPSTPTDFKKRDVGVVLEVLPVLSADKQYVNLTLSPSFSEFDGFVNYGSPINTTTQNALGVSTDTVLSENNILMPIFSDKRLSTSIDIADGATIAIGSLLQESVQNVEDQTPILGSIPIVGRLFQSKARKPISTAIIFLVNVELTNPASQSYRSR